VAARGLSDGPERSDGPKSEHPRTRDTTEGRHRSRRREIYTAHMQMTRARDTAQSIECCYQRYVMTLEVRSGSRLADRLQTGQNEIVSTRCGTFQASYTIIQQIRYGQPR